MNFRSARFRQNRIEDAFLRAQGNDRRSLAERQRFEQRRLELLRHRERIQHPLIIAHGANRRKNFPKRIEHALQKRMRRRECVQIRRQRDAHQLQRKRVKHLGQKLAERLLGKLHKVQHKRLNAERLF